MSINTTYISGPTLTHPNGGETFAEGSINVQWVEPGDTLSTDIIWYEILITDAYSKDKKEEFLQIATIPYGNTSYTYSIQKNLKGEKSRIGIRAVNQNGFRSKMSVSADNFVIVNQKLPTPALMEPVDGGVYFSYVSFIFDHDSILGRSSQRSFYQIYYSSLNQNINWTLLQGNIMVGSDPVNIDVSKFNTDSDYVFKIELVDGTNVSSPVFINNININNINLFLIDSTPPVGSIKIIDNEEYIKDTSLILQLSASDETTNVKDVQIQQTDVGGLGNVVTSQFVALTPLISWDIKGINGASPVDGVKLIQARYRDHGDNIIENIDSNNYFRTYKNLENREVSTFINNGSDLYSAFVGDDDTGDSPELYKNLTLLSTLDGDATALEFYNNILYVAIKDDDNKGVLQRFIGGSINTIADNESQYLDLSGTVLNSLFHADSVINAMEVYDSTLFMGLDNGKLLSFKGSTVVTENSNYFNIKSINNVKTDGNVLYIFFDNTTEILIMSKNSSGDYVFNTIDT